MSEHTRFANGLVSGGNSYEVVTDGRMAINAIVEDVSKAENYILMATYVLRGDETGKKLTELMCRKAEEGVEIYFIVDHFGLMNEGKENIDRMNECGIHAKIFNKPNYFLFPLAFHYQKREHRKVLVVDGRIAQVGSVSIGNKYAGWDGDDLPPWRETQIRVGGPIVNQLQLAFKTEWPNANEDFKLILCSDCYENHDRGDIAHVIDHSYEWGKKRLHDSYITIIKNSHDSLYLTYAYFVPSFYLIRELKRAVARGVDVRILLPKENNIPIMDKAANNYIARLLKGGVRIYKYRAAILHAKTMVSDGAISIIGSGNFDMRSFLHNRELNVAVADPGLGRKMDRIFFDDLENSDEITLDAWKKRSAGRQFKDTLIKSLTYFL